MKNSKKILIPLLFALIGFPNPFSILPAQYLESPFLESNFRSEAFTLTGDAQSGNWLVGGNESDCKFPVYLQFSASGPIQSIQPVPGTFGSYWGYGEILNMEVSGCEAAVLGTGWSRSADDIADPRAIFFKYSLNGQHIFGKDLWAHDHFKRVVEIPGTCIDPSYLLLADEYLLLCDSSGDSTAQINPNLGPLNDLSPVVQSLFQVASNQGIHRYDTSGNLIRERLFGFRILKTQNIPSFSSPGGQEEHIAISDSTFFLLNDTLATIDSLDVTNLAADWEALDYEAGHVFVLGNIWNSCVLVHWDLATGNTDIVNFGDGYLNATGLEVNGSKVMVTGNETTGMGQAVFAKEFSFPNLQTLSHGSDASVESYSVLSVTQNGADYSMDLKVVIRNEGQDTLQSVWVGAKAPGGFQCIYNSKKQFFNGLNLPPGDTTHLFLSPYQLIFASNGQICVFTAHPNDQIDNDHSNDEVCIQQIFTGREELQAGQKITLGPVPADQEFWIGAEEPSSSVAKIELMNLSGKVLKQKEAQMSSGIPIACGDLPEGVYLLKVEFEENVVFRKILIQHP